MNCPGGHHHKLMLLICSSSFLFQVTSIILLTFQGSVTKVYKGDSGSPNPTLLNPSRFISPQLSWSSAQLHGPVPSLGTWGHLSQDSLGKLVSPRESLTLQPQSQHHPRESLPGNPLHLVLVSKGTPRYSNIISLHEGSISRTTLASLREKTVPYLFFNS